MRPQGAQENTACANISGERAGVKTAVAAKSASTSERGADARTAAAAASASTSG